MASRLILVAAMVLAVANAQISVSWSDCGSSTGAIGKVTDVQWTPQSPTAGENVTITATVSFTGSVTALHGDLEFLDGIIQNHFNGCKGATISAPLGLATITFPPAGCPISGPTHKFVRYVKTSPLLPAGSTESILKVNEQNGKPFICCSVKLTNA
jgi:hypothetical protein